MPYDAYTGSELTALAWFYRDQGATERLAEVRAEVTERYRIGVPERMARRDYDRPPCVGGGMGGMTVEPLPPAA